jgi:dTDP-glucose 4,6-dehydratase
MSLHGSSRRYLVTGGAGFIGSALVRHLLASAAGEVLVVDKLTYAANLASLDPVAAHPGYRLLRADVADGAAMREAFASFSPDVVLHLAAESHVDRSIDGPGEFVRTNVVGTYTLLHEALRHFQELPRQRREAFRFVHVSTDEVFGALGPEGRFSEASPYRPKSPYSASKAGADHLVEAWHHTYGLPAIITNSSNNFGPCQFPEKLIPLAILNALEGKPIGLYGDGRQVRDWLFVEDHARCLALVAGRGRPGERYAIGGSAERANVEVVRSVCRIIDELRPDPMTGSREKLIRHVADRPGHDFRYAMDTRKVEAELGWAPREAFESDLATTVRWYLDNEAWWRPLRSEIYRGERLGVG